MGASSLAWARKMLEGVVYAATLRERECVGEPDDPDGALICAK